ncbi:hypothetical protein VNI00_019394 [Paramarasmius palmivorus]|uniref:Uncharacterized protein n=1 Tax=Paramarasmius palmivorus TaxID=297713 RepID=A0AAW0ANJ9_9AGAR
MPRVRLYHTKSEVREANRQKSAKSYEKYALYFFPSLRAHIYISFVYDRHKVEISKRRKVMRDRKKKSTTRQKSGMRRHGENVERDRDESNMVKGKKPELPVWMRKLHFIEGKVKALHQVYNTGNHKEFLDAVYHKHIISRKSRPVEGQSDGGLLMETYDAFERIARSCGRLQDMVWNAYGAHSEAFSRVKEFTDDLRVYYISNLGEMVCQDMVGLNDLIEAWRRHRLPYQK